MGYRFKEQIEAMNKIKDDQGLYNVLRMYSFEYERSALQLAKISENDLYERQMSEFGLKTSLSGMKTLKLKLEKVGFQLPGNNADLEALIMEVANYIHSTEGNKDTEDMLWTF